MLEYSLKPPIKPVMITYASMGESSGTVMLVKMRRLLVPSTFAASYYCLLMLCRPPSSTRILNGSAFHTMYTIITNIFAV